MNGPQSVEAADQLVGTSRDRLDGLVAELDRRRHLVARARNVLRKYPGVELAIGLLAIGVAGGAVALAVRAKRKKPEPQILEPAASAPTLALARPDATLGKKLMTTALTALLSVAVKAWAQRLLARVSARRPEHAHRQDDTKLQLGKG